MLIHKLRRFINSSQVNLPAALGVTGGAFAIARLIQLASAVWLSRVLTPYDFGVLAIVTAIQAFSMQITAVNLGAELVRCSKLDSRDVEVAWTYEFLKNIALWAVLFIPADYWAGLLNRPDATIAVRISSLGFIISAFRNPYLVQIRRDRLFALLGVIDVVPALVLAVVSVSLVVWTGSYMGVIYAMLASLIASTCLSYLAFAAQPRFRFSIQRVLPMLQFGGKLFIASVAAGLESNFPVFLVASLGQTEDVGYLNRAYAFSIAIALSVSAMIWRVTFPHYAQLVVSGSIPLAHALRSSSVVTAVGLAVTVPAIIFSKEIVSCLLGTQWTAISALWSLLLCASILSMAASPLTSVLHATRNENTQIAVFLCGAVLAVALCWLLYTPMGLLGIGVAVLLANALMLASYNIIVLLLLRRST